MRMWMVATSGLCDRHLIAEHAELHGIAGGIAKGRTEQVLGLAAHGKVEIHNLRSRHNELADEMIRRDFNHHSELVVYEHVLDRGGEIDIATVQRELMDRCEVCERRFQALEKGTDPGGRDTSLQKYALRNPMAVRDGRITQEEWNRAHQERPRMTPEKAVRTRRRTLSSGGLLQQTSPDVHAQ